LLTWGRQNSATVLNATTGARVCVLRGHVSAISVARIFPDGSKIITGGFDESAIIWNSSTCEPLHRLRHSVWVTGVAVLGDGETVATISIYGLLVIWRTHTGERLRTLVEPPPLRLERTMGVQPFPKGDLLATFTSAEAIVWNTSSGDALHRFVSAPDALQGVAVSPGGDVFVTCSGGRVTIWNASSGAELHRLEDGLVPPEASMSCFVAIALGGALDEQGFGNGFSWRDLPWPGVR